MQPVVWSYNTVVLQRPLRVWGLLQGKIKRLLLLKRSSSCCSAWKVSFSPPLIIGVEAARGIRQYKYFKANFTISFLACSVFSARLCNSTKDLVIGRHTVRLHTCLNIQSPIQHSLGHNCRSYSTTFGEDLENRPTVAWTRAWYLLQMCNSIEEWLKNKNRLMFTSCVYNQSEAFTLWKPLMLFHINNHHTQKITDISIIFLQSRHVFVGVLVLYESKF